MDHPLYKWIVLISVSLANFSAALDVSIILVSFPRLVDVFHTDASVVIWIAVAFTMTELGLVLTLAKVGDSIGRKKVFIFGLILYTTGLVFCSLSHNIGQLIISRIVQGAGAAMGMTIGGAIVVAVFPKKQQGRAIGIFSMLIAIGLIAGPVLGGLILDYLDWRGIFYTRIPIGIISLILTIVLIKEQETSTEPLRLDIGGSVTLLGSTSCLLLFLNLGSHWGYLDVWSLLLIGASVVLLILFIYFEKKAAQPVLDLRFFRSRIFTMAGLASFMQMTTCVGGPMLVPFYMIDGLRFSQSAVGLIMAFIAIPHSIFSSISGWISEKVGNRLPMIIGAICITLGLLGISRLDQDSSVPMISIMLVVFGFGMGMFNTPNQSAIVGAVPRQSLGTAMGIANTIRILGSSVGTAITGTLYASLYAMHKSRDVGQLKAAGTIDQLAVIDSFRLILVIMAGVSLVTILTSVGTGEKTLIE